MNYKIEIQNGLLNHQADYLSTLASRFAIITDDTIAPLYGNQFLQTLSSHGLETHLFTFPSGEKYKTRQTKEELENQMFEKGLGRDTCVIALGGGVVTDTAGYLAATYCRGLPLVMIPTSLLGMVDASIGGKTGVNVPYGKNMLGCIYQPKKVLIDPSTLNSLPFKELSNGIVETIKHGIIANYNFFEYLEDHTNQILALDPSVLEKTIRESCLIKKEIVMKDERDTGIRHLLNFGHTVAHALENLSNYSISHGEAVALGILIEGQISVDIGALSQNSLERIKKLLVAYNLPLQLPSRFSNRAILDAMTLDKKSIKGKPRFVIIEAIGSPKNFGSNYCTHVDESIITKALDWSWGQA